MEEFPSSQRGSETGGSKWRFRPGTHHFPRAGSGNRCAHIVRTVTPPPPPGVDLTYQGLNTRFQQKDGSQGRSHAWLTQICNVLNASAPMCVPSEKDALAWWREPGRIHQAQDEQSLTLHKCDKSQNQRRVFLYKSNGE